MKRIALAAALSLLALAALGCGQKGDPRPRRQIHSPEKAPAQPPATQSQPQEVGPGG